MDSVRWFCLQLAVPIVFFTLFTVAGQAQTTAHHGMTMSMPGMKMEMNMPTGPAVSLAQLRQTVAQLDEAKRATTKYKDVRVAEAAGYLPYGPDVPGMGVHFLQKSYAREFNIDQPPILLYEKDASLPGGYRLVGVSYLLDAPAGADGQPQNPPFAKALAAWHRHEDICVLPDRSTREDLTQAQCVAQGGRFNQQTAWMVHAWIWQDSPNGVFAPFNPTVK